jgi:hypothetical protein
MSTAVVLVVRILPVSIPKTVMAPVHPTVTTKNAAATVVAVLAVNARVVTVVVLMGIV